MSTDCFTCKHFKQQQNIEFSQPGVCNYPLTKLPEWLRFAVDASDKFYGPDNTVRRSLQNSGTTRYGSIKDCETFVRASARTIKKRKSDTWYE